MATKTHSPWGVVNETIPLMLCCAPYSCFSSEPCLCCRRYVCSADTARLNLCFQLVFKEPPLRNDRPRRGYRRLACRSNMYERAASFLTVCALRWRRWWLPASGVFPTAVGWFCRNPPSWGCGELSKTGRCKFHLVNGTKETKNKSSGLWDELACSHTKKKDIKSQLLLFRDNLACLERDTHLNTTVRLRWSCRI